MKGFVEKYIMKNKESDFANKYIEQTIDILNNINLEDIQKIVSIISKTKSNNGRLFFIGVGGGAAHASHAVNDFRKIAGIQSYCVTDNVSELTARINDDSWDDSYYQWLSLNNLKPEDTVFVFSVGGGSEDKNISNNIVRALTYVKKETLSKVVGIVGPNGGFTSKVADACVVLPIKEKEQITPHTEGIQSIISHMIVSFPSIMYYNTKWESLS